MAKRKRGKRVDPDALAERIVPVEDATPFAKVLVYAKNGVGKTMFAATAPKVLILDFNEEGTRSARGTGADVVVLRDWFDVISAYWFLKRGDHEYESVALDTITAMQEICMEFVLLRNADRDPTKDPKTPSQRDYGTLKTHMGDLMNRFRNLPMHVIFTAQERSYGDPDEGEPLMHAPDLTPRVRGIAMGAVGVMGRLYQREVRTDKKKKGSRWERRMLVGPHEEYESKDRTLVLPRILREPTMQDIINAYAQTEDEE